MSYVKIPLVEQGYSSSNFKHLPVLSPPFLLDEFTGARAAFGMSKLSSLYSGYSLRVRRSSDSSESDIGFDNDGKFDSATFLSFIGGGSGYCTILYDQTGGGYHLTQATAASQPQIVLQNGEYVLTFTGGRFLQNTSFVGSLSGTFTAHISWKAPNNPPSGFLSQVPGIDWAAGQNFLSPWWTTIQHGAVYSNAIATTSQAAWEDGSWRQMLMKYSSSSVSLYEYGSLIQEAIARVEPAWSRLTIGKNDFGNGNFYFNEFALWPSDISAQALYDVYEPNHPTLLPSSGDPLYVNIGDSITTTLYCGLGKSWSRVAGSTKGLSKWYTICKGGWTLQNLYDRSSIWGWYPLNLNKGTATLTVFAGTNDMAIDGLSAAGTLTRLKTLCQYAKANGFTRTVVITPLPRYLSGSGSNLTFEPKRQTLSDSIVADTSGDFDFVVDVRTITGIGTNGDQDTTTNYVSDYTHLNATGEALLGAAVAAVW